MSLRDNLKTEKAKERYDRNYNSVETTFTQKELEEHERDVRNKANDDFAEKLKESLINNWRYFITTDSDGFNWITTDAVHTHIDELLKQLKGENI